MDNDIVNRTIIPNMIISPTFIWCFLMPLIHFLSLTSNILCIIVFFSNTFIKKPIAIYFICLLMSDSITLLIGYMEMVSRETNMIAKSSWLCMFNKKIINTLSEIIYTFMERYCLEWMLYKVLWTRASTILLAILSIQRSRTFFSLSYHETRLCAFFACISSIVIALAITCLEWTSAQSAKFYDQNFHLEIFQSVASDKSSNEFYSTFLHRDSDELNHHYRCITQSLNLTDKSNCSSDVIVSEFASLTQLLLSPNRDPQIVENTINILTNIIANDFNASNNTILIDFKQIPEPTDFLIKMFDKRQCQITFSHSLFLRTYIFLHSLSPSFNRHTLAIFFGNALPSFIVVLANLLSIKVIYFSKSLKYLKQAIGKNRRKRRLQNDLRAFLVILIESFLVILISWGLPIFLTMYHCHTLYVVSISACPKIKDYLALFLFTDLFNSSTNCLLYSLSGKLFRRKLLSIVKTILTCGQGTLWHVKRRSLISSNPRLDRQISNNPSTNTYNNHFGIRSSRPGSYQRSERLSSTITNHLNKKFTNSMKTTTTTYRHNNGQNRKVSDDGSLSIGKMSDDHYGGKNSTSEIESDTMRKPKLNEQRISSQSIRSYLIDKVRALGSTSSETTPNNRPPTRLTMDKQKNKSKKKSVKSITSKQNPTTDLSLSSSSFSGSISYSSQRKYPSNNRYSSKIILNNPPDNPSITKENISENLTSL